MTFACLIVKNLPLYECGFCLLSYVVTYLLPNRITKPIQTAEYARYIQHGSAVLPTCQHENDYRCLITSNPELNGLTGIDKHSRPDILTKMSLLTASSNSYWKHAQPFQHHTDLKHDSCVSSQADSGFALGKSHIFRPRG